MDTRDVSCGGGCGFPSPPLAAPRTMIIWAAVFLLGLLQLPTCHTEQVPPTLFPTDLKTFQDSESKYYRYMNIDYNNNKIYVGGMEFLYRLDANDITKFVRSANLSSHDQSSWIISDNREACINKGKSPNFDCRNHVRAVIVYDDRIYVCGTGAYDPQDYYLNPSDLTVESAGRKSSGRAKCPFDPNDNATCVYARSGNPGGFPAAYSGTAADFAKLDPVIFRPPLDGYDLLRTVPQESKWLYEPNFVGSFDVGDYVYFFFRETAIEYVNCGRAIYSRVARVCKNDEGGSGSVLETRWTTYLKARLNCSIPGEFPYYFNEIHDVFRDDSADKFYGVFSTNVNGLPGSAVCAFSLSSIEDAFQGDFKEQLDSSSSWQRVPDSKVPNPRPGRCDSDSTSLPDNVLQFIKARPLMDQTVGHDSGKPLYYERDQIFQKIVVDFVGNYRIFFLGTNQGKVYKIVDFETNGERKSKLLAVYSPFDKISIDALPIWEMKLHNKRLYVATDEAVVEFPVAQCSLYAKCTDCVQDPHCGWDDWTKLCKAYPSGSRRYVGTQSPLSSCDGQCTKSNSPVNKFVKLKGDPVHLTCESHCDVEGKVRWTFQGRSIIVDNSDKFFLTQDNGLILLNSTTTDRGVYQCQGETLQGNYVTLSQHQVNVTGCSEPECYWREEFQNWCNAFDEYKSELNHWKCLKRGCLSDDSCLPNLVVSECPAP